MRTHLITAATAAALFTGTLAASAPAAAAPSGPPNAQDTVNSLRAQGYSVILSRTGTAPLTQCLVHAIRPGQEVTRSDSSGPGDTFTTVVVSKSIYLDVTC
ncbi:uncharacterized protein RMCC_1149 [Mycolicibacterium canariasense]|uniref:PASTA domain-containing protein n=1 Tax=Mycolicibacterium canariasense TaxID=228230 RepID=A0A100W9Z2_MYCCR|nr:hypothetical protein [Mycolicibacterium canariasense]MCV7211863.1 hypothetical protein [Mycolicibacterium canariasense]ORU99912.1 hypothetical protein AWB94_27700 [Mycolicibacterium canariasense]GAS94183.1 uncharacterized protein RMCC_1149 [Mycolicibacterium canariasense]